jgi:hypothetical protein
MKRMVLILVGALSIGQVYAADKPGYREGQYWKSQTFIDKVIYLQGFLDAIMWGQKDMTVFTGDGTILMGDLAIGVDKVYADDASKPLPVAIALQLAQIKRKGGSSEMIEATRDQLLRALDGMVNVRPIEGKLQ